MDIQNSIFKARRVGTSIVLTCPYALENESYYCYVTTDNEIIYRRINKNKFQELIE